ncbi:MAG: hypothetical protein IJP12_03995 [Methanobrevibacter sp.]|nr:hypothetical protein [Methanobrevibacter sp.]
MVQTTTPLSGSICASARPGLCSLKSIAAMLPGSETGMRSPMFRDAGAYYRLFSSSAG